MSNRNIFKLHGDIDQKARSKTYFEFRKSNVSLVLFRILFCLVHKLLVEA